ncbi:MAG: hypothetical protein EOM84_04435 [Sphingobacteriia bacterium]|nr:hypothetical protein [Sphingobacteriia bacterium]
MFHLLKNIIWIVGFVVVSGFILDYFGYEINKDYFKERRSDCQELLKQCKSDLIHQGIDNAKCKINCISPEKIIRKK